MGFEELVRIAAPLGAGGILAAVLFWFYRQDFLRERKNGRSREDALLAVVERNATVQERLAQTFERLSDALTHSAEQRRNEVALMIEAIKESRHVGR